MTEEVERPLMLTQGHVAWVDPNDYERVSGIRYHARVSRVTGKVYAARKVRAQGKQITRYLHQDILDLPLAAGVEVDHINGDGLDNRRENIRPATTSQNQQNSFKPTGGSSQFKGVSWLSREKSWRAQIRIGGVNTRLGDFKSEEAAACAYDAAALKHFGEFARPNLNQGN